MAKLEGVKTLDMVNGEITKVEYNGEVYERVGMKDGKEGDIGLRVRSNTYYANIGEYYPITINRGKLAFKDDEGQRPYIHEGLENFAYFRKPSSPTLKVGDKVRLISESPKYGFGLVRVGGVGKVRSINGEDVSVDFPNHTNWYGIMADLELAEDGKGKRTIAIAGDVVEMTTDDEAYGYKKGDKFTTKHDKYDVYIVDNSGFKRYINEYEHLEYRIVEFAEEIDREFPEPAELFARVNRPNNVPIPGDYVEFQDYIAGECSSFLTVGKKYEVESVDAFGGADITDDKGYYESADTDETKAIYVKYTQEQAEREPEVGDKILVVDAKTTGGNYGNGDILTVSTGYSKGVFVEEFARGLWNEEFIVLNPEQVGEPKAEAESVEESEVEEAQAEGVPFEVGQFVVSEDNNRYTLTIPEAGALEVVEVGDLVMGDDIRVKFHREFKGKYGVVAGRGATYLVNSDYFRLATDEEIVEALGLNEIKEGDKVEVLAENHPLLSKGATFTVTDVYENGVKVGAPFVAFVSHGKPRIKLVEEGEKQPEIKSKDLPVGTEVRGKGTGFTYTLYGRSPECDGNYGKAYYVDENKVGWIGEEQFEVISKPETIEVGDLVQVVDSPSALLNGSYFVVKGVSEDGSTLRGVRPNSVFNTKYVYAANHVKLIAKAGEGEGDRFYG